MSDDFDLHAHTRKTKLVHADAGQDGTVVWQPLLEVPDGGHDGRFAKVGKIKSDFVDLRPALATSVLQSVVDIGESLVNFLVKVGGDLAGLRVPATFRRWLVLVLGLAVGG